MRLKLIQGKGLEVVIPYYKFCRILPFAFTGQRIEAVSGFGLVLIAPSDTFASITPKTKRQGSALLIERSPGLL